CQLRFIRERLEKDCLSAYVKTLEAEVRQYFDEEWPGDKGQMDIRASMIECLSRTSIRCLMGNELRAKMHSVTKTQTVSDLLHTMEQGMLPLSVFWPSAPIERHRKRDAARQEFSDFLAPIINDRRSRLKAGIVDEDDFLWKVLSSTYPDGTPITDE
ncbi:unnamed protein product, partial [Polarella glacialis]